MDKIQYFEALSELFLLNGLEKPTDALSEKLYSLSGHLLTANKIHNLTAIKEEEDVIVKHFIDSLFLSEAIDNGASVVDVGCGPGFPSLPLAVYRDDLSILGIDSTSKKINYVNDTAKNLGLNNISAISARAEEMAHKDEYRETYDVATARAVASLPVLCELCLPFVKIGGYFVAMKSHTASDELAASRQAIVKCGGEYVKTIEKKLVHRKDANEPESRSLIVIKKVCNTPENYPRIYAKILKKPL